MWWPGGDQHVLSYALVGHAMGCHGIHLIPLLEGWYRADAHLAGTHELADEHEIH